MDFQFVCQSVGDSKLNCHEDKIRGSTASTEITMRDGASSPAAQLSVGADFFAVLERREAMFGSAGCAMQLKRTRREHSPLSLHGSSTAYDRRDARPRGGATGTCPRAPETERVALKDSDTREKHRSIADRGVRGVRRLGGSCEWMTEP